MSYASLAEFPVFAFYITMAR